MPAVRLAGAAGVAGEDLEDDVGAHGIGLLPAVGHTADIVRSGVDEHDELAVHPQEAGIFAVAVADVGQVVADLGDRGIAQAFIFIVERPAEAGPGGCRQDAREFGIRVLALAPPGGDAGLDVAVLHHLDVLLDDILVGCCCSSPGMGV